MDDPIVRFGRYVFARRRIPVRNHRADLAAQALLVELERGSTIAVEDEIGVQLHRVLLWLRDRRVQTGPASYFLAVICARSRSSCSLSSGVSSGPKSSVSKTWRISTSPSSKGARLTHSIASSIDFTWISQKPATNSFVSAKGPSITVRFPPENRMRAPFELGWSPS